MSAFFVYLCLPFGEFEMKTIASQIAVKVKVLQNRNHGRADYAQIKVNGQVRHVGQPAYIRRVARKRYNVAVNL
jgi:hypothetical protein